MANELSNPNQFPVASITASDDAIAVGVLHGDIVNNQLPPEMLEQWKIMFGWAKSQMQQPAAPVSHALEWAGLSHDRFCLFVLDDENYKAGAFAIAKTCALTKYTPDRDYFRPLTLALREEIKQMPCIFAKRNLQRTHTSSDHPVVYGKLTDIVPQGTTIKFCFEQFKVDYQQTINENISRFGLLSSPLRNQLDEEHWCIRYGNLQQILVDLGINVE